MNCIPFWVLESNKQVSEIPLGCELGSYLWVEAIGTDEPLVDARRPDHASADDADMSFSSPPPKTRRSETSYSPSGERGGRGHCGEQSEQFGGPRWARGPSLLA